MDTRELADARYQLVVKDNALVQKARYDLTTLQQKFLCYLITKIKPSDVEMPEFEIRVTDFCAVAGIDPTYFYTDFQAMIKDFHDREVWIRDGNDVIFWMWFSDVTYHEGAGCVSISLSKRLNQYLLDLSKHYTRFELINVLMLKSKYAIRLFELLKSYDYRHKIELKTEDLKRLLYVDDHYPNFSDFRRFVLTPATREINSFTELDVEVEEKRTGRKITSVVFHIEQKPTRERLECYQRAEYLLDGRDPSQMSLFDRTAHDQAETT